MLTDEYPAEWHTDEYLRAWAINHKLNRYPLALVPLRTYAPERDDTAEIDFGTPGNPVRRFKRPR